MLHLHDAGILAYRPAWDLQLQFHEQVQTGTYPHGVLMLVAHPPVIHYGHRPPLHVTTDLSYFELTNPRGLSRPVTSIQKIAPSAPPTMPAVKHALIRSFQQLLTPSR